MFTRVFEHLKNQEAKTACMLPNVACIPVATKALSACEVRTCQSPSCCHSKRLALSATGGACRFSPTAPHPDGGLCYSNTKDARSQVQNVDLRGFRCGFARLWADLRKQTRFEYKNRLNANLLLTNPSAGVILTKKLKGKRQWRFIALISITPLCTARILTGIPSGLYCRTQNRYSLIVL